jgi:predicted O-linked N-acetylglucosamine transferase (SPINDLY family)
LIKKKRRERNNLKTNKRVSEVSLHIDVDAELDKALSFHQAGNLQQAEERYRKILKANPQNEDALHFLGVLVFQLGQYDTASDLICQAIKLNPEQSIFFDSLGTVLKAQRDTKKAMEAYYRALEINPNNFKTYNNIGVLLQEIGKYQESIQALYKAIAINPKYDEAIYNLGLVLQTQGRLEESIQAYQRVIHLQPDHAGAHNNLGNALQEQGRLEESIQAYQQVIHLQPGYVKAHNNLGIILKEQGRLEESIEAYQRVIHLQPDHVGAHNNLGNALQEQGRLEESIQAYQQAIHLRPQFTEAYYNLGSALQGQGRLGESIEAYQQAIHLQPDYVKAYNNLGIILKEQGRLEESIEAYQQVIHLQPDYVKVHNNLGNALQEQGRLEESIQAYQQAIHLRPDYAEAYSNLGVALQKQGRLEESVQAHQQAIHLQPDYADAYSNLGNALREQGRLEESIQVYQQAIHLRPDHAEAYNNLGNVLREQRRLEESIQAYQQAIHLRPDYAEAYNNLIFSQDFHPDIGLQEQQAERQKWNQRFILPLANSIQLHPNDRNPERLLRIGYVSADFRRHSAAQAFGQLILNYNRKQFDVFCYSGVVKEDELTKRFKDAASGWYSTLGKSDKELVEQIRNDKIDILVDLSGHTSGNRLLTFGYKPAPIQVTGIGHDAPGVTTIDYRLTTSIRTRPEEEKHFVEKPVYLDFSIGFMIPSEIPSVGYLPAYENGHVTFGCLNKFSKTSDDSLELWTSLLKRIPNSKLLLKSGELNDMELRGRTIDHLSHLGVAPNKVILLGGTSQYEHLNTYNQVDISLDTFPYGGGITTFESLCMGSPVVGLTGGLKQSHRNSSAILSPLGLNEWVAKIKDEYVEIACHWASNLGELSELRQELRDRVLTQTAKFVPQIEIAYREMWSRWCRREESSPIYVK